MKRIVFLIISVLCLAACNNEVDFVAPEIDAEEWQITLHVPDAVVQTYSTATESECMIDSVWVLEFNSGGTTLLHDTLIKGANILGNGKSMQLLPQLPFKPAPGCTIVFIANLNATAAYPTGIQYSNVSDFFPIPAVISRFSLYGLHIPMYGEILNWSPSDAYSCEVIRAMAKIQIQMAEDAIDVTGNFNPDSIIWEICNAGRGGYVQPQATLRGEEFLTYSPYETQIKLSLLQKKDASEEDKVLYVNEFPASKTTGVLWDDDGNSGTPLVPQILPVDSFSRNRAHVVLTKKIGAISTYYRLDFYDSSTKKFIDIKRNYHYIFTIHGIGSEGYPSLDLAKACSGSNIEYTVQIKGDGSNHISSNGQYVVITNVDTAYVTPPPMGYAVITIGTARAQVPAEMTYIGEAGISSTIVVDVSNPTASAAIYYGITSLTGIDIPLEVRIGSTFESGRLKITYGNIVHYVVIKKK
jgi:hypothetical protein